MKRFVGTVLLSVGLLLAGAGFADAALVGNPKSKVYHVDTCQFYKNKTAAVKFASEAQAKAQGFAPCKGCVLAPAKQTLPKATNEPYVGNPKTKVFHKAGCKVAPKKNPVGIQNLLQAHKNGFKPCKTCNPAGAKGLPK